MKLLDRLRYSKFKAPMRQEILSQGQVVGYEELPARTEIDTLSDTVATNQLNILSNEIDIAANVVEITGNGVEISSNDVDIAALDTRVEDLEQSPGTFDELQVDYRYGWIKDFSHNNVTSGNFEGWTSLANSIDTECFVGIEISGVSHIVGSLDSWQKFWLDVQYSTFTRIITLGGVHHDYDPDRYWHPWHITLPAIHVLSPYGTYYQKGLAHHWQLRWTSAAPLVVLHSPFSNPDAYAFNMNTIWWNKDVISRRQVVEDL